jgi:hypothetical protein
MEINNKWMVRRSYKGEMLVLEGGYENLYRTTENRRINQIRRETWLTIGTLVAGLGAIAIVAWEIVERFCLPPLKQP